MLLAADLNKEIDSKKIDLFMIENRLLDIYIDLQIESATKINWIRIRKGVNALIL